MKDIPVGPLVGEPEGAGVGDLVGEDEGVVLGLDEGVEVGPLVGPLVGPPGGKQGVNRSLVTDGAGQKSPRTTCSMLYIPVGPELFIMKM